MQFTYKTFNVMCTNELFNNHNIPLLKLVNGLKSHFCTQNFCENGSVQTGKKCIIFIDYKKSWHIFCFCFFYFLLLEKWGVSIGKVYVWTTITMSSWLLGITRYCFAIQLIWRHIVALLALLKAICSFSDYMRKYFF